MNKASLERALKKTTGAALKRVEFQDDQGNRWNVDDVFFDDGTNTVVLHGARVIYEPNLNVAS